MIASCNPNSLLSEFSPSNTVFCDLSSILHIRSIRVIVLIDYKDPCRIPLLISEDIKKDSDVFFCWICKSIVLLSLKIRDHHPLIEWWESSLRTITKIYETHTRKPLIGRERSSISNYLRKCSTLPLIGSPKSSLWELRIQRISSIAHGSRVRSMYHQIEILIVDTWSPRHEYLPIRDNSLLPVYIRNPREKWENIWVWWLDWSGHKIWVISFLGNLGKASEQKSVKNWKGMRCIRISYHTA
jgi:hypothetical protein